MNDSVPATKRSRDVRIDQDIKFSDVIRQHPLLLKGLEDSGYDVPSPIQLKALPLARFGVDLIAQAKSGTGKTVVFSVIALETIDIKVRRPQALMIAPTREIALQICNVITKIGKYMSIQCQSAIGGQVVSTAQLQNAHIIVGTPGKLMELLHSHRLDIKHISLLVLDEADKLLDESLYSQTNFIFKQLPTNKRCVAFSATFSDDLVDLLKSYMNAPHILSLADGSPALSEVQQYYVRVAEDLASDGPITDVLRAKFKATAELLSKISFYQCIIFLNHPQRGTELAEWLTSQGWKSAYINADLDQAGRNLVMKKMRDFRLRVLVCSDLISRGIDIERVNLVINADFPRDVETYFHRVGRSGRFGTSGIAISLVGPNDIEFFDELLQHNDIKLEPLPNNVSYSDYRQELSQREQLRLKKHQDERQESSKKVAIPLATMSGSKRPARSDLDKTIARKTARPSVSLHTHTKSVVKETYPPFASAQVSSRVPTPSPAPAPAPSLPFAPPTASPSFSRSSAYPVPFFPLAHLYPPSTSQRPRRTFVPPDLYF